MGFTMQIRPEVLSKLREDYPPGCKVVLVEMCNLARQLQITVLLYLTQSGLAGIYVSQFVLKDSLHGCPYVCTTDGEVVNLYGFC